MVLLEHESSTQPICSQCYTLFLTVPGTSPGVLIVYLSMVMA